MRILSSVFRSLTLAWGLSLWAFSSWAQAPSARLQQLLPEKDLMPVGVYYYPEQWPEDQWDRDLKNMAAMGFTFTHYAEFAWARLEPQEGRYDFTWLDKALDLAAKNGLKVILCTPSPCPPAWLTTKYPDVLMVDDNGRTMVHGGRTHGSWSSPRFRQMLVQMNTQLAQRYGKHPAVWGWQLDNEPSHYGKYDFSENARQAFQTWLKKKYGSIQALNQAWGASFWSNTYTDFSQIRLPNGKESTAGVQPTHQLDAQRFMAEECASFLSEQAATLRQYIEPRQWIITNYMVMHTTTDARLNRDLDFITYTAYPVAGSTPGVGQEGFRRSTPDKMSIAFDFHRPISGITGVMELQPGQVNWGSYNPQPSPGAVRLWLWHSFAGGLRLACSYRFRQPRFGYELYHYGMMGPDGVTPSPGGKEFSQFIAEQKQVQKAWKAGSTEPAYRKERRTAFLYAYDNAWDLANQPHTQQWRTMGHFMRYYTPVKEGAAPVDVIDEKVPFEQYPFLVAPSYQLLDERLVARFRAYVEQGGHLLLTCRTGTKDRNAHLWEAPFAKPIWDLIGAQVEYNDQLPDTYQAQIQALGRSYTWNTWGEILKPQAETEVLARFASEFYKDSPAVVRRKLGKGTVTYIGTDTDEGALERALVQDWYAQAGKPLQVLPEGLRKEWRDGFWVAVNYGDQEVSVGAPTGTRFLIGAEKIGKAGVAVWRE